MTSKKSLQSLVRHLILEMTGDSDVNNVLKRIIDSKDLQVEIQDKGNSVIFLIKRVSESNTNFDDLDNFVFSFNPSPEQILARLELVKSRGGPCRGAWEVGYAYSNESGQKWGRFLYDVAIEKLGLIMSDREMVSKFARPIWKNLRSRPDIERLQLDDIYDTLTPGFERDNCAITPWDVVSVPGKDYDLNPEFEADIKRLRGVYLNDPVGKERERPKSLRTGPRKSGSYKLTAPKHASLKDVDETSDDNKETREYYWRLLNGDLSAAYRKKGRETPVLDSLMSAGKLKVN